MKYLVVDMRDSSIGIKEYFFVFGKYKSGSDNVYQRASLDLTFEKISHVGNYPYKIDSNKIISDRKYDDIFIRYMKNRGFTNEKFIRVNRFEDLEKVDWNRFKKNESRSLIKMRVYKNGNQWNFTTSGQTYIAVCPEEQFVKLLAKLHAKDDKEEPRSYRSETYRDIAQEIIDGTDNTIYVWSNDLNSVWGKNNLIYKSEEWKPMKIVRKNESVETIVNKNEAKEIDSLNYCVFDVPNFNEIYLVYAEQGNGDYHYVSLDKSDNYISGGWGSMGCFANKYLTKETKYDKMMLDHLRKNSTYKNTKFKRVNDIAKIEKINDMGKVKESVKSNKIVVREDFCIPGTNIVLEKGDTFEIITEKYMPSVADFEEYLVDWCVNSNYRKTRFYKEVERQNKEFLLSDLMVKNDISSFENAEPSDKNYQSILTDLYNKIAVPLFK